MVQQIASALASFWELLTAVHVPGLGIPFSVLYLGIFAISLSIKFLAPLLGLGGNVADGPLRAGRAVRASRSRHRREDYARRQAENTHYVIVRR